MAGTTDVKPKTAYVVYVVKGAGVETLARLLGLEDPEDQDGTDAIKLVHERIPPLAKRSPSTERVAFQVGRRYRLSSWEKPPRGAQVEHGARGARYLVYQGEPRVKAWLTGRRKRQSEHMESSKREPVAA